MPWKRNTTSAILQTEWAKIEAAGDTANKTALKSFVTNYFDPAGSDLISVSSINYYELIPDWSDAPSFLKNISNSDLRKFAKEVNMLWPDLSKGTSNSTRDNPEKHTLLFQNNTIIVPGSQ